MVEPLLLLVLAVLAPVPAAVTTVLIAELVLVLPPAAPKVKAGAAKVVPAPVAAGGWPKMKGAETRAGAVEGAAAVALRLACPNMKGAAGAVVAAGRGARVGAFAGIAVSSAVSSVSRSRFFLSLLVDVADDATAPRTKIRNAQLKS